MFPTEEKITGTPTYTAPLQVFDSEEDTDLISDMLEMGDVTVEEVIESL